MHKVAIIDDDKSTNDRIHDLLKAIPDISIVQEFDGKSAEQRLSKEHFDVIILDIDLGEGPKSRYGGFDLLSGLRDRKTTTLVVSGMQETNLADVSISLRAYDFIGKPFSDIELFNKFEHALEAQLADPRMDNDVSSAAWPVHLETDNSRVHGLKWKGKSVGLSLTQSRLVHRLLLDIGKPVAISELAKQLKSANSAGAVASHFTGVRQRFLDADPDFNCIRNEPGLGYVWQKEK